MARSCHTVACAAVVALLLLPSWAATTVRADDVISPLLGTPPQIDGRMDLFEWRTAARVDFSHGFLAVGNDRTRLYLLVDVLGDDVADPRIGTSGDWIEVVIDMDGDGSITPNDDRIYTLLPDSYDLRVQEYASSDGARHPIDPARTYSSVAAGFGCFTADGTERLYLPPLAPTCAAHRLWEVAIDLEEVGQDPSSWIPSLGGLHVGVVVHSENPAFTDEVPDGFLADFGLIPEIELATVPAVITDPSAEIRFDEEDADSDGNGVVDDPLEITQAVQTRDNALRLVARKETAVRVYVEVREDDSEQLATVWLYGTRDGHDLPGSPLAATLWARPHADFPLRVPDDPFTGSGVLFGRDNLDHSANFRLPESWTEPDNVTFDARARFAGQEIDSRSVERFFHLRKTPYFIVFPVNEGTSDDPVRPSDDAVAAAESYIKAVYPVPDIRILRLEYPGFGIAPTPMDGAILRTQVLEEFLGLYDLLVAAGVDPLPDQIFAYTATSTWASAATASATCTSPGCGHVAGGNTYGDSANGPRDIGYTVMAHEIDHNIAGDESWGGHVPGGVDPTSVDPEWMRLWEESEAGVEEGYDDFMIREFGFDTRLPWTNGYELLDAPYALRTFTVVPPYFREFMCALRTTVVKPGGTGAVYVHPVQWTSPYRWEHMFDAFAPESPLPARGPRRVAYVSGTVRGNGAVILNPVFVLPGPSRVVPEPDGTHALAVYYHSSRYPTQIRFTPRFTDVEGNQLDASHFHFNVPLGSGIERIEVRAGKAVLAALAPSKHSPRVKVVQPYGNATWKGRQTVEWRAYDQDGDALRYAVLYSPDRGKRWVPVATDVEGTEREVDMDLLPGGSGGKFEIVATDGFNTADAVSPGFLTVDDKPPSASILRPAAGSLPQDATQPSSIPSVMLPAGRVRLEADGSDLEDGALGDESFLWFYGQERTSLGRGRRVEAHLGGGMHPITLVVVDSAGNTTERRLAVIVPQSDEVRAAVAR